MLSTTYFLGCPMWANRAWQGSLLEPGRRTADFLSDYARVLNTVEGNTTFYAVPNAEKVRHWRDQTPPSFRFCFKFPKVISHELALLNCEREVASFFEAMAPLGRRLGPFFLQLPPSFCDLDRLSRFLTVLPKSFRFAVEVRHPAFFAGDAIERDFEAMLTGLEMDRVLFDTERLMTFQSSDDGVKAAQRKKPSVPRRTNATGRHPFLRYAGLPSVERDEEGVRFWADQTAAWLAEGKQPFVFMHQVPEDDEAPELCRMFHHQLQTRIADLGPMPEWPGERAAGEDEGASRQMPLF